MRVLKWIVDRIKQKVDAKSNSFGFVPNYEDINWSGLEFNLDIFKDLTNVPKSEGLQEIEEVGNHFDKFGSSLPEELENQRKELHQRLEQQSL